MGKLKNLSIVALFKRFGQSIRRFPLAMLFTLLLVCFLFYIIHGGHVGEKEEFFLVFYPATGALLAVALSLFTEDFKKRIVAVLTQVVIHAAWLGISVYLAQGISVYLAQIDRFSIPQLIAVVATVFAIGLAIFVICFYRKNQEMQFWNFSIRTAGALVVSVAISGALTLGLLLLVESLKMLFDIEIHEVVYADIWTVCMCLLAPVLFMILIPEGEDKYMNEAPEFSRFTQGVVQYLFLPLLGLYLITLYVYAAKILLQWSLPVGGVSYLVSGSMVLMVLLIYVTFPVQYQDGNKLFKGMTRWLPVVMLPLLALMSVAIGRRLSDYGITISRLYLLVFNVWCYAVCLWLIFTRNRRIWLIPTSFAVILFLISVGPQSIANITKRHLLNEARDAFMASGFTKLPLTDEQYKRWAEVADPDVVAAIDSKLAYLCHYEITDIPVSVSINSVVINSNSVGSYSHHSVVEDDDVYVVSYSNSHLITDMTIPQGYTRMTYIHELNVDPDMNPYKLLLVLKDGENPEEYRFLIDVSMLKKFDEEGTYQPGEQLAVKNDRAMLVIDDFRLWGLTGHDGEWDFEGEGILFTK